MSTVDTSNGLNNKFVTGHQTSGPFVIKENVLNPSVTQQVAPQIIQKNYYQFQQPVQTEDTQDIKTEEIVEKINTLRKGKEFDKQLTDARNYLQDLRELGGLSLSSDPNSVINVPGALEELAILSGISATKAPDLKMEILDTLITLLRRDDPKTKSLSFGLVKLAIDLTRKLDNELVQTEIIEVQIKIALAYHEVLKNILSHYKEGHINGITKELKDQLLKTNGNFDSLNTNNNPDLTYAIECAQEAIKRVQSDENLLRTYLGKVGNVVAALGNLKNYDLKGAADNLKTAASGLDQKVHFPWYGSVQVFGYLGNRAKTDIEYLKRLNDVYQDKAFNSLITTNWKCTYAYVDNLFEVVQRGQTKEIRSKALELLSALGDCNIYKTEKAVLRCVKQMQNLPPVEINFVIRRQVASCLEKLLKHQDEVVRKGAKMKLMTILATEEQLISNASLSPSKPSKSLFSKKEMEVDPLQQHRDLAEQLRVVVPSSDKRHAWMNEMGEFASKKTEEPKLLSLNGSKTPPQVSQKVPTLPNLPTVQPPQKTNGIHPSHQQVVMPTHLAPVTVAQTHKPEEMTIRLARCLGVAPEWLEKQRITSNGISLRNPGGLSLSSKGVEQLVKLIQAERSITKLDLSGVELDFRDAETLAQGLINSGVTQLILDTKLMLIPMLKLEETDATMKHFAEAYREKRIQNSDLQITCNSRRGYASLGVGFKVLSFFILAEDCYKKGIQFGPQDRDSALIHYRLGRVYESQDQLDLAWKQAEEALKIDKYFCRALELMADIHDSKDETLASKKIAYQVYKLEPWDSDHLYNLAASISTNSDTWNELRYALELINNYLTKGDDQKFIKLKNKVENLLLKEPKIK